MTRTPLTELRKEKAEGRAWRTTDLAACGGAVTCRTLAREGREVRPEPIASTVQVGLATGTYETTPPSTAAA